MSDYPEVSNVTIRDRPASASLLAYLSISLAQVNTVILHIN